MSPNEFQELVWQQGRELYRDMPWRDDTRPYYVLVSELMLQQTQVDRVRPKFEAFIAAFPDIQTLAQASLADVLRLWQGLGYNRRAKFLHEAARKVITDYNGIFPSTDKELLSLPGVGVNTAGALRAYSFNQPAIFIETNVRTVYFYHFFQDQEAVTDLELRILLEQTMDTEYPREWYWALMDYGSWLKRQGASLNTKSSHYKKQSPLKGSVREIRGRIIAALSQQQYQLPELQLHVPIDERFAPALAGLKQDGLVTETAGYLHLTK